MESVHVIGRVPVAVMVIILFIAAEVQGQDSCFFHDKTLQGLKHVGEVTNFESQGRREGLQVLTEKAELCQKKCQDVGECSYFTVFNQGYNSQIRATVFPCSLHKDMWKAGRRMMIKKKPEQVDTANAISGPKNCGKRQLPSGICPPKEGVGLRGPFIKYKGYKESPTKSVEGCGGNCETIPGCNGWMVFRRLCRHVGHVTGKAAHNGITSQNLQDSCPTTNQSASGQVGNDKKNPCFFYDKRVKGLKLIRKISLGAENSISNQALKADTIVKTCHGICQATAQCSDFTMSPSEYSPVISDIFNCFLYKDSWKAPDGSLIKSHLTLKNKTASISGPKQCGKETRKHCPAIQGVLLAGERIIYRGYDPPPTSDNCGKNCDDVKECKGWSLKQPSTEYDCRHYWKVTHAYKYSGFTSSLVGGTCSLETLMTYQLTKEDHCPTMEDVAIYGIQITAYLRDGGKQDKTPMSSTSNCGGNCDDEVACGGWSLLPETKAKKTKTCKHYLTVYRVQVGKGVQSGMKKGSCIDIEEGPCPTMTNVRLLGQEMQYEGYEISPTSINCADNCIGECKGWSLKQEFWFRYVCKHFRTVTGSIVDKGFFSKKLQAPCSLRTFDAIQAEEKQKVPECFVNNYYKGTEVDDIDLGESLNWMFNVKECQSRCKPPGCTHVTYYLKGRKYDGNNPFNKYEQKQGCKLYKISGYAGQQPPGNYFGNVWNEIATSNYWSGPASCGDASRNQLVYCYLGARQKGWAPRWVNGWW